MAMGLGISLSITGKKESAGIAPVPSAPVNLSAPFLSGENYPTGELFINRGVWTGFPSVTFSYQWYSNDVVINGETARTYTVRSEDAGNTIKARVTATNTQGSAFAETAGVLIEESTSDWLVASGVWNDNGVWDDNAAFND